ncbi:MAG: ASCH domain-containing protein [Clostridia bacterium]
MKVISIKQPWASLIVNGYKEYEFRNWNTNLRGPIFIHASQNIEKEKLKRFEHLNLDYPIGKIIGSANITASIKVDTDFENKLISENELIYGATRNRTGYAFRLEEIKKNDFPFNAKGELGFWNYYDEIEVMKLMDEIQYGWLDKYNTINNNADNLFLDNYILQSPKEIIRNKIGICWDQVELERYYFKNNDWNIKTYFIVHYDNGKCPTHTFLTFEKDNKYYWFEHSWNILRGVHIYNSMIELLSDMKNKFVKYELNNNYVSQNLILREYKKPKYHISTQEFYNHCEQGVYIDL